MFWDIRKEEEVFFRKEKPEEKELEIKKDIPTPETDEASEKLNKITEQINLMSRYLTYLSEKLDRTIDSAITYDRNLDDIEARINTLRQKIENLDVVDSSVKLEKSSSKKAI